MLGADVARAAARAGWETVALGRSELDITDAQAVARTFERVEPQAAVNCAAWTDVDGAEAHRAEALAVNADGAGNLARAAAEAGASLVHVSTDYVFSGEAPLDGAGAARPYVESDAVGPRTAYGETKLAGELQVLEASPAHAVVRTAWLFGVEGHNFAATTGFVWPASSEHRRRMPSLSACCVVSDQIGCPTWTGHLAPALIGLIERGAGGVIRSRGRRAGFTGEMFSGGPTFCTYSGVGFSAESWISAPREQRVRTLSLELTSAVRNPNFLARSKSSAAAETPPSPIRTTRRFCGRASNWM